MKPCNKCVYQNDTIKNICNKCSHNYEDMYEAIELKSINKFIDINNTLYELEKPAYLGREIPEDAKYDWCISQYHDSGKTKFVIARLKWLTKDKCFELNSIGMRLAEYGSKELLDWILLKEEELTVATLKDMGEEY